MKTAKLTKKAREAWKKKNDYDWYIVDYDDGETLLKHNTALSSILQCGHNPKDYGIINIDRCGGIND